MSKDQCDRHYQKKKKKKRNNNKKKKAKKRFKKCLVEDIKVSLKKKKNIKQKYDRRQYKNLTETEKERLVEYRKRYYEIRKNKKTNV